MGVSNSERFFVKLIFVISVSQAPPRENPHSSKGVPLANKGAPLA
jgi:hypothetical protein